MVNTNQLSCIEQLNIANARLHELSHQVNTWMWETNADHIFTYFSNNLEQLTNLKICDLVGTSRLDAALTSHEKSWHEHAKNLTDQKPFTDFQYKRLTPEGGERHIIVSGWPLFDETGDFVGFRGTGRDQTDELSKSERQTKKEEHLLSEIEHQRSELNTVLENLSQSVLWFDQNGIIRLKNARTAEIVDFKNGELDRVATIQDYLALMAKRGDFGVVDIEKEVEARAKRLCEPLKSDRSYRVHLEVSDRYLDVNLKELPDGSRILTQTDVTKEAKVKRLAKTREKMMKEIISNMDYAVVLMDNDLNVDYANNKFGDLMGFDEAFLNSHPDMEEVFDKLRLTGAFEYPDWDDGEWRHYVAVQRKNILKADAPPVERTMADGRTIVEKVSKLANGKRMLTFVDVTDQKQREETLSHILNAIDYGTLILDADYKVELANKPFSDLMKIKPKILATKPDMSTVLDEMKDNNTIGYTGTSDQEWEDYKDDVCQWVTEAKEEPSERLRADGKTILSGCVPLPGDKRLLTYFDVSDVKLREKMLATLIKKLDQGVMLLDKDMKVKMANSQFSLLWGMDEEFFVEHTTFVDVLDSNRHSGFYPIDGNNDESWSQYKNQRISAIRDGDIEKIELQRGDGKTLLFSAVKLPGDDYMLTYFDITDLKKMENDIKQANELLEERVERRTQELRKTQSSLVKKERQALLGDLVASLCHELRNPLNALNTSMFIIRRKVEGDFPKLSKAFDRSERTIGRCTHILDDLYDYALVDEIKVTPVDMEPWLKREAEKAQVPMAFNLSFNVDEGLSECEIDEAQLGRAVRKLVSNAAQAIAEKLDPTVAPQITISAKVSGESVRVIIEDNGPGMDEDTCKKALEPLYSTRGFGVGLGLPIAQQTVKRHGGSFDLLSQEGKGTSVLISLPIKHDTSMDDKPSTAHKPTLNGKHRAA